MNDLFLAASEGDTKKLFKLLKEKHSPNCINEDGQSPLHLACQNGHLEVVRLLLKMGADIEARSFKGWTPLFYAVVNAIDTCRTDVVKALVTHGANRHVLDYAGMSLEQIAEAALNEYEDEYEDVHYDRRFTMDDVLQMIRRGIG